MFIGQLTRQGFTPEPASFEAAAARFRADRYLRLDRFVEPALLETWRRRLGDAPFKPRVYTADVWDSPPPFDFVIDAPVLLGAYQFAMHDAGLFRAIEAVAGCARVRSYEPVIYRMLPGHTDSWHDDLPAGQERLVTFSLNMSEDGYTGGALEFSEDRARTPRFSVENHEAGGALIFALSPSLEHRVAPVTSGARTVFAGWFSGRAAAGFGEG